MKIRNILWLLALVGLFFTGCTTSPTTKELQAALEAEKAKAVTLASAIDAESDKQESLQDSLSYHQRNNDIYRKHVQDAMDERDASKEYSQDLSNKYTILWKSLNKTTLKRQQLPTMLPLINLHKAYPSITAPEVITDDTIAKEKALLDAMRATLDAMEKMEALHQSEYENYSEISEVISQQMHDMLNAGQDETIEYYDMEIKWKATWDACVQAGSYSRSYESQLASLRESIQEMEETIHQHENQR